MIKRYDSNNLFPVDNKQNYITTLYSLPYLSQCFIAIDCYNINICTLYTLTPPHPLICHLSLVCDDLSVQGGTYRQFTLNVHPFHIYQQCVDKEGKVSTDTVLVVVNINPAQIRSVLLHCLSGGMDGYFLVFDFFDINVLCFHKGLGLQQI